LVRLPMTLLLLRYTPNLPVVGPFVASSVARVADSHSSDAKKPLIGALADIISFHFDRFIPPASQPAHYLKRAPLSVVGDNCGERQ